MKRGDQPGVGKKPKKRGPATKRKALIAKARRAELERQEQAA